MMKGSEFLRFVDQLNHDKNIPREIVFEAVESAVKLAMEKYYGEEETPTIVVTIDRDNGEMVAKKGEEMIDPSVLGRISAQSAKQAIIQKIREAESSAVMTEYQAMKGELVHGTIQRHEGGAAIISLGKTEAILPRSEQIPGETHHVGERVKAVVLEVKKVGQRVKIILSRTHADFVRRLFENEIPEIADRTIEIKALAREAGYRAKIAVSSIDLKVDCVGACVGVRGSRIKNVVDELGGERIDIVRWNDSLQVMIPNALQPANIEEVFLYSQLGRAIVLVQEDQLSLAIGRRGQNVRLASKLVGWDIEIMTHDELGNGIERAEGWFRQIPGVTDEIVEKFIEEGFLSYDDLTFLEAAQLGELIGVTEEAADDMIQFAEEASERVDAENRAAKALEAQSPTPRPAPVRSGAPTAADIFPEPLTGEGAEPKMTAEQLFGPDDTEPAEQQPVADQQVVVISEPEPVAETQPDSSDGETK
ncbi:MAG TPA: transcription termination factor NusA [Gemmataceae bacterium]|nr:transcription termination factor NusA [Gemmataceae bacterium]